MESINSQSLSGLTTQQLNDLYTEYQKVKSNTKETKSTDELNSVSVTISSEAVALFQVEQKTLSGNGLFSKPSTTGTSSEGESTSDDESSIDELQEEIDALKEEIATLKNQAMTDEKAADELNSKQAELVSLQAELASLQAADSTSDESSEQSA